MQKGFQFLCLTVLFLVHATVFSEETEEPEQPKPIPVYSIRMISPKPEDTFQNDAQSITVSVEVTPALEAEDKIVIYVDGTPSGEPVHSTSISLPWLERGSHTLRAEVIQPKGQGAQTPTITIYQQRTSAILSPQRGNPISFPK